MTRTGFEFTSGEFKGHLFVSADSKSGNLLYLYIKYLETQKKNYLLEILIILGG